MKYTPWRDPSSGADEKYEQAVVIMYVNCRSCEKQRHMLGHIFCKACYVAMGGYA